MAASPSTRMVKIESADGTPLTFKTIAQILGGVQDLYYLLGEQVLGRDYRAGGPPASEVREAFDLEPVEFRRGSVLVQYRLPKQQAALEGPTPAQQVDLSLTRTLAALQKPTFEADALIADVLPDVRRRRRVLEVLHSIHTGPGRQKLTFERDGQSTVYDHLMAERARQIRDRARVPPEETLLGWLHELNLKALTCTVAPVLGPSQKLSFGTTLSERLRQSLGRVVRIQARRDGAALILEDDEQIQVLTALPVERLDLPHGEVHLDPPVEFDLVMDETKLFIATNDSFGIVASGRTFEETYADAVGQLREVWDLYADAPDEDLTEGAIALKQYVRRRLGASP